MTGALFLADDIVQICESEKQLHKTIGIVLQLAFEMRLTEEDGVTTASSAVKRSHQEKPAMVTRPDVALALLGHFKTTACDGTGGRRGPRRGSELVLNTEIEKSVLYLGARKGNDISKLFFAHLMSSKKRQSST